MRKIIFLFIIICLLSILSCTYNPFYNGVKMKAPTISGVVIFDDNSSPENVVVWLDQLNISCKTDKDGVFKLPLPPPEMQGMNMGISGTMTLYFYYSNYEMITRDIKFSQGNIAFDQEIVDDDGKLKEQIVLEKLVTITTNITPNELSVSDEKHVYVNVQIVSKFDQILRIESLRQTHSVGIKPIHCGLIFEPVEENYDSIFVYDYPRSWIYYDSLNVGDTLTINYEMIPEKYIDLGRTDRSPANTSGTYNVFPYLKIRQPGKMWDDVPHAILDLVGVHHDIFGRDYNLLPMTRNDAKLTITY